MLTRALFLRLNAAIVGGFVGAAVVGLRDRDDYNCSFDANGDRLCIPTIAEQTPLWVYGIAALVGMLAFVCLTYAFERLLEKPCASRR